LDDRSLYVSLRYYNRPHPLQEDIRSWRPLLHQQPESF
jgi:hypothetical protein